MKSFQDELNRKKHNENLIERMRKGESLQSHDAISSWFPPRPIIEKDKEALKQLYASADKQVPASKTGEQKVTFLSPVSIKKDEK